MLEKFKANPLIYDNLILFSGTTLVNFLAFLFHFYMGRVLGPADYGVLGVILSIITIMGIGLNTLQTGITKYTSDLNAKKEYSKISNFLRMKRRH